MVSTKLPLSATGQRGKTRTHRWHKMMWQTMVTVMLAAGVLLLPHSGQAAEKQQLTAGIKSLIGMRIPPLVPRKQGGKIPKLQSMGSYTLLEIGSLRYGMEEGFISKESGFIVDRIEPDLTQTILDGRTVSQELMSYAIVGEKGVFSEKRIQKYRITPCELEKTGEPVIGLMRPEVGKEGCEHWSKQVKEAWRLNTKSEKLEDISPKGVRCYYGAESGCE